MGARLTFDPDALAADSPAVGPGAPWALRQMIYLLLASCMQPACVHCSTMAGMLADYDSRRVVQAPDADRPNLYPCLLHGIQPAGHVCDWTEFIRENNEAFERMMAAPSDAPPAEDHP